eukprot:269220-Rhodomonas_salina.1
MMNHHAMIMINYYDASDNHDDRDWDDNDDDHRMAVTHDQLRLRVRLLHPVTPRSTMMTQYQ